MIDGDARLPAHWCVRENTWDALIFQEVVELNQYGLPPALEPESAVLDIGAHCGSFSWGCLVRGAGRVFAYEIDEENFALLRHNLDPYRDAVVACNAAVWRSDIDEPLFFQPSRRSANTGGGSVNRGHGIPVGTVTRFDDALAEAARQSASGRVRLVKLDAEGSEFPILYTSECLDRVDEIVGEYHDRRWANGECPGNLPPCSIESLGDHLRGWGFTVEWRERAPGIGMFASSRNR
jgi:FkbM family methyltransferase